MKNTKAILIAISILSCGILFSTIAAERVKLSTNYGDIIIELNREKAPITVENFLSYINNSFYDETIFHRVIKSFMIQAGGMTEDLQQKSTQSPITNEADNGLSNLRGTIAMGRTTSAHSATSHFFINTVNNTFLNHKNKSSGSNWGYCVFGEVVEGMDVVDAIENVQTTSQSGFQDVPATPVIITSAKPLEEEPISNTSQKFTPEYTFQYNSNFATIVTDNSASLTLFSLQGRILKSNLLLKQGTNTLPLSSLPSGSYIYTITTSNGLSFSNLFVKP